jgi:hypothetical protein
VVITLLSVVVDIVVAVVVTVLSSPGLVFGAREETPANSPIKTLVRIRRMRTTASSSFVSDVSGSGKKQANEYGELVVNLGKRCKP